MSEISAGSGMYPFDTVATYNGCVTGYALVGDSTSRCTGYGTTMNGVFDGTPPTCEGVHVCVGVNCECRCDSPTLLQL